MTEQTKYEKVEHYIWEDKVRQWKECLMCGAEWTPISLVKGLCPECRGILETEIYSIAIKKLKNIYEKNGYIFDEEAKAIISDENNLIKCVKCAKLVLSGFKIENDKIVCHECFYKRKNKPKKNKKEEEDLEV